MPAPKDYKVHESNLQTVETIHEIPNTYIEIMKFILIKMTRTGK